MKTTFAPGTIVSSRFLNGAQQITFDDRDEDWSYPKLTPSSLNLPSMGSAFMLLTGDQSLEGLKTFSVLPQSSASATEPNDFLTLKDVEGEEGGFLRLSCVSPQGGEIAVYDGDLESWVCQSGIYGGTY